MTPNQITDKYLRPSWDEYFIGIVKAAAARGTCDRGRTACCVARDKQLLVTGYVGAPRGCTHCDEMGHEMHKVINTDGTESQHCIRTSHAEINAIAQAAKLGIALDDGTLYCLMFPCYTCAKMLINCGIKRVVSEKDYHASKRSKEIFDEAGVQYEVILNGETVKYDKQ